MALVSAAAIAGSVGLQALKQGKKQSVELFGYDFIRLLTLLSIYFIVAWAIEQYFKARIAFDSPLPLFGVLGFLANLILKHFESAEDPDLIPTNETINKLFTEGYQVGGINVKYWDVVKVGGMMIIFTEFYNFNNVSKSVGSKPSTVTNAIFGLLIVAGGLVTLPKFTEHIQKVAMR